MKELSIFDVDSLGLWPIFTRETFAFDEDDFGSLAMLSFVVLRIAVCVIGLSRSASDLSSVSSSVFLVKLWSLTASYDNFLIV